MTAAKPLEIGTLITHTPDVYGGRACLAGTRYPVLEVAVHYNAGESAEQIAADYDLPLAHVYAGIAYYLANRPAFDAELEAEQIAYEAALQEHMAEMTKASA